MAILDGRLERRQVPREVFFRVIALDNQSLLLTLQYISLSLSQHKTKNSAPLFSAAPGRKVARARERERQRQYRGVSLFLFFIRIQNTVCRRRTPPRTPPIPRGRGAWRRGTCRPSTRSATFFFFFFLGCFFSAARSEKKKKKTLAAFEPFLARLRPPSGQIPALPTSLAGARPRPVASCIAIGWETCGGNRLFSVRRKERLASLPRARDALFSIPPIFYSHVPTLSSTRSINSPLTG